MISGFSGKFILRVKFILILFYKNLNVFIIILPWLFKYLDHLKGNNYKSIVR